MLELPSAERNILAVHGEAFSIIFLESKGSYCIHSLFALKGESSNKNNAFNYRTE
jgi:hypothetical protein